MEQALEADGSSLALIRKDHNHETVKELVMNEMVKLNNFVNASRKMSLEQMEMTADLIIREYYYLKLHEVQYVFEQAMCGRYGKLYESLDGFKIMEWINTYDKVRTVNFEVKLEQESHERRKR